MISDKSLQLLKLMADGEYHSGEVLGRMLGVSRAAVWKSLENFAALGLDVRRQRGRGYRIDGGMSLLDATAIRCLCNIDQQFDALEVLPTVESTNKYLLEKISANDHRRTQRICLAEMQEAGRGRRGRSWQSPFASNVYLSVSWQFDNGVSAMAGLSLAVGVVVAESLEELGCRGVELKWPNDILVNDAKLGGVLVEITGDAAGLCHAVVGVGVNVSMPALAAREIDQSWTDLAALMEETPHRNTVVVCLLQRLSRLLACYENHGFAAYRPRWQARNAHKNERVLLSSPSGSTQGIMRGVTATGAIELEVDGRIEEFIGGELSLRVGA